MGFVRDGRQLILATAVSALALHVGAANAATFGAAQLSYDNALLSQFNLVATGSYANGKYTAGNVTAAGTSGTNGNIDGRSIITGNYTTGSATTDCSVGCTGASTQAINSGADKYGATTVFGNVVGGLAVSTSATGTTNDIDIKGNLSNNATYNANAKGGLNFGGLSYTGTVVSGATEIRTTESTSNAYGSNQNAPSGQTIAFSQTMSQIFAPFGNSQSQANLAYQAMNLQRGIAALPGTPNVTAEALPSNNATFFTSSTDYSYNGVNYGVVTTTLANLAAQGTGFTGVANGAGNAATFVIVTGDGANALLPTLTYADSKVIYDFVDATTLRFGGNFTGSILAPLATITYQNGTLNGSIVAAALTQTKELLFTNSFNGDLSGLTGVQFSAVPEPASILVIGAGLGGLALLRRRRR